MAMETDLAARAQDVFIHPLADVEEGALIGTGTKIWRYAHVRSGARLGEQAMVGNCSYIDTGAVVGSRVRIQNGVLVYQGVTIEDDVFVGPSVTFTNDLYPRANGQRWTIVPTRVCRGAAIGANSTIVCGVTIGEYATVGAGSVVTRDVPPYTLVRGNPAEPAGYVCPCGRKLSRQSSSSPEQYTCEHCGKTITITASTP